MKPLPLRLLPLWTILAASALAGGCDATSETPTRPSLETASYVLQFVDGKAPPTQVQSPPASSLFCTGATGQVDSTYYTYGVRLTLRGGTYRAVVQHLMFQASALDSTVLTGRYEVDGQTLGLITASGDTVVAAPVPSLDDPRQLLLFNLRGEFLRRPATKWADPGCKVLVLGAPAAPPTLPTLSERHANGFKATFSATHVVGQNGLLPLPRTIQIDKYSTITLSQYDVRLDGSTALVQSMPEEPAGTYRYATFKNQTVVYRGTELPLTLTLTPDGARLKNAWQASRGPYQLWGRVQR